MRRTVVVLAAVAAAVLGGAGVAAAGDDDGVVVSHHGHHVAPCSDTDGVTVVNCLDAHQLLDLNGADVAGGHDLNVLGGDDNDNNDD